MEDIYDDSAPSRNRVGSTVYAPAIGFQFLQAS